MDDWQNNMLTQTISIVKKVIEGRPIVQCYIQVYRGDDIWLKDNNMGNYKNLIYKLPTYSTL